jgi:hypothetical protein
MIEAILSLCVWLGSCGDEPYCAQRATENTGFINSFVSQPVIRNWLQGVRRRVRSPMLGVALSVGLTLF